MNLKYVLLFCVFAGYLCACSDDEEKSRLDVDFQANVQNISAGGSITFTDLSIGKVSKWDWTFDGGTPPTSTLQNPTVSYTEPGTYTVTLQVSNADGSESITREGFVVVSHGEVSADFEASKTTAIQGENVVFTDLSTGSPDTWSWEFIPSSGPTITSTEQNPVIAFATAGVYTVKLTASNDDNSHQVVRADYVIVIDVTSVEGAFAADKTNIYTGATVQFEDKSVGTAEAWSWTFEGGTPSTSSERHPAVVYNTPGRYKVTLQASNDENSSTVEVEDYIVVVPGADLIAFYPFDGDAADAGPNAVAANNTGAVTFTGTDRLSVADRAAVFNGAGALIVPDHTAFNFATNNYTVSCWVKTPLTTKMMIWQESGANGVGDKQTWLRIGDNATDRLLRFATEDSGGGAILNAGTAVTTGVGNDAWHHVVCVREAGVTRIYIDGAFVTELVRTVTKDVSSQQDLKIGAQEGPLGTYHTYFNGQMDDMIIYGRALTAAEVAELYNL